MSDFPNFRVFEREMEFGLFCNFSSIASSLHMAPEQPEATDLDPFEVLERFTPDLPGWVDSDMRTAADNRSSIERRQNVSSRNGTQDRPSSRVVPMMNNIDRIIGSARQSRLRSENITPAARANSSTTRSNRVNDFAGPVVSSAPTRSARHNSPVPSTPVVVNGPAPPTLQSNSPVSSTPVVNRTNGPAQSTIQFNSPVSSTPVANRSGPSTLQFNSPISSTPVVNRPAPSTFQSNSQVTSTPLFNRPPQSTPQFNSPVPSVTLFNRPPESAPQFNSQVRSASLFNRPPQSAPQFNNPALSNNVVNMHFPVVPMSAPAAPMGNGAATWAPRFNGPVPSTPGFNGPVPFPAQGNRPFPSAPGFNGPPFTPQANRPFPSSPGFNGLALSTPPGIIIHYGPLPTPNAPRPSWPVLPTDSTGMYGPVPVLGQPADMPNTPYQLYSQPNFEYRPPRTPTPRPDTPIPISTANGGQAHLNALEEQLAGREIHRPVHRAWAPMDSTSLDAPGGRPSNPWDVDGMHISSERNQPTPRNGVTMSRDTSFSSFPSISMASPIMSREQSASSQTTVSTSSMRPPQYTLNFSQGPALASPHTQRQQPMEPRATRADGSDDPFVSRRDLQRARHLSRRNEMRATMLSRGLNEPSLMNQANSANYPQGGNSLRPSDPMNGFNGIHGPNSTLTRHDSTVPSGYIGQSGAAFSNGLNAGNGTGEQSRFFRINGEIWVQSPNGLVPMMHGARVTNGNNGYIVNGQGANGQISNGQAPNRQDPNGQAPNRQDLNGQGPEEQDSEEEDPDQQDPNEQGSHRHNHDRGPNGRGSDGRGPDGQGPNGQGNNEQNSDGQGSNKQDANGQNTNGNGTSGQGTNGQGNGGQSANRQHSNEQGTYDLDAKGRDANGQSANGQETSPTPPFVCTVNGITIQYTDDEIERAADHTRNIGPDIESDTILRWALGRLCWNVNHQPTYIMTHLERNIYSLAQHNYVGNEVARRAVERYWNNLPPPISAEVPTKTRKIAPLKKSRWTAPPKTVADTSSSQSQGADITDTPPVQGSTVSSCL